MLLPPPTDTVVTAGSNNLITSGAVATAIASSDAFAGQFFNAYSTVIGDVIGVVGYITYMRVAPKKGLLTLNVFIDANAESGYNFTSIDKIGYLLGLSFKHPSGTYSTGNWVCAEWSDWGFGQTVNVNPDGSLCLARFFIRDQAVSGQWPIGTLGNRHYQIWGVILEEN